MLMRMTMISILAMNFVNVIELLSLGAMRIMVRGYQDDDDRTGDPGQVTQDK